MRVGVVGAGITGLALAHALDERDVGFVVLEARDAPGGVIHSERVDGRLLEFGPQRVRLTPPVEALVDDLGLRDELVTADPDLPLHVYVDGRLRRVPFGPRAFLATDLLTAREKLRLLAEPLTGPGDPDGTAAAYLRHKFGPGAYRKLVGPLFGGTFGSDPARMPARRTLEPLLRAERRAGSLLLAGLGRMRRADGRPPAASFADGLDRLPEALHAAVADRVRLDTPAEGVRERNGRLVVETPGGDEPVDHLVVTAPAPAAADLLEAVAPSATRLRELTYNPLVVVHLLADPDAEAMGYQVAADAGLETLGVTWNASLFGRDGVHTAFLGGMRDPDAIADDPAALGRTAAAEFERVVGAPAEVLRVTKLPWGIPAHDTSWAALDDVALPPDIELATNYTGRMGISSRLREATSVADRLAGAG